MGFPAGSLIPLLVHDGPLRPAPFDFMDEDGTMDALLPDSFWGPPSSESVNRVVACPRVLGFCGDSCSYAPVKLTTMVSSQPPGALIDGGANICLTGDLAFLTDVVAIPPILFPLLFRVRPHLITVALHVASFLFSWTMVQFIGKIAITVSMRSKLSSPRRLLLIRATFSTHGSRRVFALATPHQGASGLIAMTV